MKRFPDWEERLTAVLQQAFARPFQYGRFDCYLFIAECVEAMTGIDLSEGKRGSYSTEVGAGLIIKRAGCNSLEEIATQLAAKYGGEEIPASMAQRGDVLLSTSADGSPGLGICVGEIALVPAVGGDGLTTVSIANCYRGWRV